MPNQIETFRQLCAAVCYPDTTPLHDGLDQSYLKNIHTTVKMDASSVTSMLPFLAVPLKERLVLLCLSEEATMEEIKAALPFAKETDVRQTSHRIRAAIDIFNQAMEDPTAWMHPGPFPETEPGDLTDPSTPFPFPDRMIPRDTDKQLRQVFFPEAAVLLFGDLVPESLATLGLRARAILYLVTVEEFSWQDIETLLECSEWSIRQALKGGIEALGGIHGFNDSYR